MDDLKLIVLGLLGVLAVVAMLVRATRDIKGAIAIIVAMTFCTAIVSQLEGSGSYGGQTWMHMAQVYRAEAYLGCSILLTLIVFVHAKRMHVHRVPFTAVLVLLVNCFAGILDTRHDPAGGAQRVVLAGLSIGSLMLMIPALLESWDDFLPLLRGFGAVGVIWAICTAVQVVRDHTQIQVGPQHRFVGLLGNPQGTAVYLGPQATIILWLVVNDTNRRMRWVWAIAYAAFLGFVAWSGSRTGALLTISGAMFVLYARLGRAVLLFPLVLAGLFGVSWAVGKLGIEMPLDRFLEGGDTRTDAWVLLIEDALHTGIFGEGLGGVRFVENSFLLGWVCYGPFMFALLLVVIASLAISAMKLRLARPDMPPSIKRLSDLVIGYYFLYFTGAFFEWYMVARVEANTVFIVAMSCIASSILHLARNHEPGHEVYENYETSGSLEYAESGSRTV